MRHAKIHVITIISVKPCLWNRISSYQNGSFMEYPHLMDYLHRTLPKKAAATVGCHSCAYQFVRRSCPLTRADERKRKSRFPENFGCSGHIRLRTLPGYAFVCSAAQRLSAGNPHNPIGRRCPAFLAMRRRYCLPFLCRCRLLQSRCCPHPILL